MPLGVLASPPFNPIYSQPINPSFDDYYVPGAFTSPEMYYSEMSYRQPMPTVIRSPKGVQPPKPKPKPKPPDDTRKIIFPDD